MDEEELLDSASTYDISNLGELDEAAILGDDDEAPEGSGNVEADTTAEEAEELDYDEDPEDDSEKAPRSSKFSSERASQRQSLTAVSESASVKNKSTERLSSDVRSESSVKSSNAPKESPVRAPPRETPSEPSKNETTPLKPQLRPGPKVLINPHYKGIIRAQPDLRLNWNATAAATVLRVPSIRMPPPPSVVVVPQVPPPPLPFKTIPSSSADFSKPPPSIMPLANFTAPPPRPYTAPFVGAPPPAGVITSVNQWDQLVEGFLRRTTVHGRPSRHHSRSRSSSSSSRSRSRSYSSRSSSSSGSSRSSSRSRHGGRLRSRRSLSHRSGSRHSRNDGRSRGRYSRQKGLLDKRNDRSRSRDRRTRATDIISQEKTIECAKAIGLDSDYLSKLEEQKKMREEILRKKEERRFQNVRGANAANVSDDAKKETSKPITERVERPSQKASRKVEAAAARNEKVTINGKDRDEKRSSRGVEKSSTSKDGPVTREPPKNLRAPEKSQSASTTQTQNQTRQKASEPSSLVDTRASNGAIRKTNTSTRDSGGGRVQVAVTRKIEQGTERPAKKKAYLAVVVRTANSIPPDVERMKIIAATVGPTKKVWTSTDKEDKCVFLVFESHDSAKNFMLQYNGKVISGVRLAIKLEKVFANLAEL